MSKYFKLRRFTIQCPIDALQVDETKDGDWVHYRDARDEIKDLERQLADVKDLTEKYIQRTENVLQALYEDGSEEGHSEFFYRMNSKEQCLHEGFLRKLKQLKEKGGE